MLGGFNVFSGSTTVTKQLTHMPAHGKGASRHACAYMRGRKRGVVPSHVVLRTKRAQPLPKLQVRGGFTLVCSGVH